MEITITDPNDPRDPGEVLEQEPLRGPSRRTTGLLLALVLLVLTGVWGTDQVRDARAASRERAEREALEREEADRPGIRLGVAGVSAAFGEDGKLLGAIEATSVLEGLDDDREVVEVRLRGDQLSGLPPVQLGDVGQGSVLVARARVDCVAVARGEAPSAAGVEVDVLPPSGRVRTVTLDVPDAQVRSAAFDACERPDPLAVPGVGAGRSQFSASDVLLLDVKPQPFAGELVVRAVTARGFAVRPQGFSLPYRADPGGLRGSVTLSVGLRVVSCAAARDARLEVVVEQGGRTYRLEPGEASDDPEGLQDLTSYRAFLESLVAGACT